MRNPPIIGITGLATSGKDTLCRFLIENFEKVGICAKRFALADELKLKIRDFLIENFGIDILTANPEEKELVRPLLVAFGKAHRQKSEGTFWTSILEDKIRQEKADVSIITDIRYDEYDKDESWWLREHLGGPLVHVSRVLKYGNTLSAPNEDEARNDPKLFEKAAYRIKWETSMEVAKQKTAEFFQELTNG